MATYSQQVLNAFSQEIGIALIRLLPRDWESALLTLEVTETGLGTGLAHNITNSGDKRDVVLPDESLMLSTRRLELYCKNHQINFARTTVHVWRDGEDWEVDLKFHYDDENAGGEKKSPWKWLSAFYKQAVSD